MAQRGHRRFEGRSLREARVMTCLDGNGTQPSYMGNALRYQKSKLSRPVNLFGHGHGHEQKKKLEALSGSHNLKRGNCPRL
jgi:hypothetical protein